MSGGMGKKVAGKYFRDILSSLNECEVQLQKDPRVGRQVVGGWYHDHTITIRNRPDRDNMVLSLIHEALHHLYPDTEEYDCDGEGIDLLARQLFCTFSTDQLKQLEYYLQKRRG